MERIRLLIEESRFEEALELLFQLAPKKLFLLGVTPDMTKEILSVSPKLQCFTLLFLLDSCSSDIQNKNILVTPKKEESTEKMYFFSYTFGNDGTERGMFSRRFPFVTEDTINKVKEDLESLFNLNNVVILNFQVLDEVDENKKS